MGLSLLILSSATANITADPLFYVKKHLLSIGLGVVCAVFIMTIDYKKLMKYDKYIYLLLIILLLAVDIKGIASHGSQQWLSLGPFIFQPSEMGKLMLIIFFASYFVNRQGELKTLKDLIPSFLYFSVPFILILVQDMGTALVYLVIFFGMLYMAGAKSSLLLGIIGSGLAVVILAIGLHLSPLQLPLPLEEYQINRLTSFLDPYNDPHGTCGISYSFNDFSCVNSSFTPEKCILQSKFQAHLIPHFVQNGYKFTQCGNLQSTQSPNGRNEVCSITAIAYFMVFSIILNRFIKQNFRVAEGNNCSLICLPKQFFRLFTRFYGSFIDLFKGLSIYFPCCRHILSPFPLGSLKMPDRVQFRTLRQPSYESSIYLHDIV
jgi:hypothetical protein